MTRSTVTGTLCELECVIHRQPQEVLAVSKKALKHLTLDTRGTDESATAKQWYRVVQWYR